MIAEIPNNKSQNSNKLQKEVLNLIDEAVQLKKIFSSMLK